MYVHISEYANSPSLYSNLKKLIFLLLSITGAPLSERSISMPFFFNVPILKSPVCSAWSALIGLSRHHLLCFRTTVQHIKCITCTMSNNGDYHTPLTAKNTSPGVRDWPEVAGALLHRVDSQVTWTTVQVCCTHRRGRGLTCSSSHWGRCQRQTDPRVEWTTQSHSASTVTS